nr:proline-rich receptor-like protein kinase PERK2 [Aegilops tauschii subsp. strangulata]
MPPPGITSPEQPPPPSMSTSPSSTAPTRLLLPRLLHLPDQIWATPLAHPTPPPHTAAASSYHCIAEPRRILVTSRDGLQQASPPPTPLDHIALARNATSTASSPDLASSSSSQPAASKPRRPLSPSALVRPRASPLLCLTPHSRSPHVRSSTRARRGEHALTVPSAPSAPCPPRAPARGTAPSPCRTPPPPWWPGRARAMALLGCPAACRGAAASACFRWPLPPWPPLPCFLPASAARAPTHGLAGVPCPFPACPAVALADVCH